MSIPPLVCSTPPPPEQCEDERDAEDFDIHYNLSQDDEDNSYSYGAYSDFIYPTSTSTNIQDKWSPDISKKAENKLPNDLLKDTSISIGLPPESNSSSVNKVGIEDIVIEDLNLKLEDESDLPINDVVSNTSKSDPEPAKITIQLDTSMASAVENDTDILPEYLSESNDVKDEEKISEEIKTYVEGTLNETEIQEHSEINKNIMDGFCLDVTESTVTENSNDIFECDTDQQGVTVLDTKLKEKDENVLESIIDERNVISESKTDELADDFGDFDGFQFISSENNPASTIEYSDNPWDTEVSNDCEFGDFTANFDGDKDDLQKNADITGESEIKIRKDDAPVDDTDDFSDFDDFKSSAKEHTDKAMVRNEPPGVSVLNLYTPESEVQIIENINSVLSSIFTSEISALESNLEIKSESLLNETWGHLVETDVRQPYMVNWNNSLGQKSLLKALCIDSRNILFGPKWNHGMPKYAVNLTVAPLQPQKPLQSNIMHAEDQNMDKNTNRETKTWTDPFTSDGQESCNTESGSTPATRPTNLDVFTNVPPEKEKIYSSTLSVQPIRQISLPDTHIFTPTDSETPRSKTIHYDLGAGLVPQPSQDKNQRDEAKSKPKSDVEGNNVENEEDYWEFQDFKGSNNSKSTTSENPVDNKPTKNTVNSSTASTAINPLQILQPIKVEPIMPTLNWPAPGEVKDTFDDFSEFVSNTHWSENTSTTTETENKAKSKHQDEFIAKTNTLDDDFETFQSAPTAKTTIPPSNSAYQIINSTSSHNFNSFQQNISESNDLPHIIHSKTDSLSLVKPKEDVAPIKATINSPIIKDNHVKSLPILSSGSQTINTLLQPSIAGTSGTQRGHQKTGQILQPLSLESYSQINWPNPGIDLQDLSRFNPVESLQSLKNDVSAGGSSRHSSPAHKDVNVSRNEIADDDIWGDFVSSKPKQQQLQVKKLPAFPDDDEWTDFVSSPSVKQNGLNTISLNVHTNLNMQKTANQGKFPSKNNHIPLDIPTLNYVTPKSSNLESFNDKHFQNL